MISKDIGNKLIWPTENILHFKTIINAIADVQIPIIMDAREVEPPILI